MKMKKSFIVMGLMLAASALTNCSKDDTAATDASDLRQGFTLRAEYTPIASDTRTTLDPATGKVAWDAEDELLVFCRETGTEPASWEQYKFTTTEEAAAQGIFTCPDIAIDPAKSYDWYIINNYAGNTKYMKNPETGTITIGNQTQTGSSTAHLSDSDGIVGMAQNVPGTQSPSIRMNHIGSLMKFTLVNKEDTPITQTKITLSLGDDSVIAGFYTIDYATGEVKIAGGYYKDTSLTLKNAPAIEPNGTFDAYYVLAPLTLASGDKFNITVTTDKGISEQSRTMIQEVKFEAGKMNTATIDVTLPKPEEASYTLLTDISELTVGSKIIIANLEAGKALGAQRSNNREGEAVTISGGNLIENPAATVSVLTVGQGTTNTGYFTLNDGDGYLYAAGSSKNYLKIENKVTVNSEWEITIAADGIATIKATGSNNRNWMRFNSDSDLFSCYRSGQKDVYIFKKN